MHELKATGTTTYIASCLVLLIVSFTIRARADEQVDELFHVRQPTYACHNRDAVDAINNAALATDTTSRRLVENLLSHEECSQITYRSPWRLISIDGHLSYMTYAGLTAPPNLFYFEDKDLFGEDGLTPEQATQNAVHALNGKSGPDQEPAKQTTYLDGLEKDSSGRHSQSSIDDWIAFGKAIYAAYPLSSIGVVGLSVVLIAWWISSWFSREIVKKCPKCKTKGSLEKTGSQVFNRRRQPYKISEAGNWVTKHRTTEYWKTSYACSKCKYGFSRNSTSTYES